MGNIDLAIRGKLLVARQHPQLLDQAWQEYEEGFRFIQEFIKRRQSQGIIPSNFEIFPLVKEDFYRAVLREKDLGDLELLEVGTYSELERRLCQVNLLGNPELNPYGSDLFSDERINFASLPPDLTKGVFPCYFNVSDKKLQELTDIRDLFLAKYAFDILNLNGLIKCQRNGKTYTLTPPIVEYSNVHNNFVFMDGLTRFVLAQMLDRPIGVVVINRIREDLFPVPFEPLSWDNIVVRDFTQEELRYGRSRFPTTESLLEFYDVRRCRHTNHQIVNKHPQHYFVRNLSPLGIESTRIPQEITV